MSACLQELEYISADVVKCIFDKVPPFYIRLCYVQEELLGSFAAGVLFDEEAFGNLVSAGECFAAEQAAVKYLERSEQCERQLYLKLRKKKFSDTAITAVLSYLKNRNYISDERFARSWLRNRAISHAEGKKRLFLELLSRGISRKTAEESVDEFFDGIDEEVVLAQALDKCCRTGKSEESICRSLLKKGFTFSQIRRVLASKSVLD